MVPHPVPLFLILDLYGSKTASVATSRCASAHTFTSVDSGISAFVPPISLSIRTAGHGTVAILFYFFCFYQRLTDGFKFAYGVQILRVLPSGILHDCLYYLSHDTVFIAIISLFNRKPCHMYTSLCLVTHTIPQKTAEVRRFFENKNTVLRRFT